jgi:hypothetical protein
MVGGGVGQNAKTTVFQARILLPKNGGLASEVEKCVFPREKRDRYGFTPLKWPGFLLKTSQTMRIPAENTRIHAETTHKPTIATPIPWKPMTNRLKTGGVIQSAAPGGESTTGSRPPTRGSGPFLSRGLS